jgi:hypothetical protein
VSLYDYVVSKRLGAEDAPFYALIMAAIRKADTENLLKLKAAWPEIYKEFEARYFAPGGLLKGDAGFEETHQARGL